MGLLVEFTLFSVWDVAHFVCGGWQWDRFLRAPGNAGQFLSELQSIQALANELGSGLSFGAIFFSELVGKLQKLLGNRFRLGEAIRFVLRAQRFGSLFFRDREESEVEQILHRPVNQIDVC